MTGSALTPAEREVVEAACQPLGFLERYYRHSAARLKIIGRLVGEGLLAREPATASDGTATSRITATVAGRASLPWGGKPRRRL